MTLTSNRRLAPSAVGEIADEALERKRKSKQTTPQGAFTDPGWPSATP